MAELETFLEFEKSLEKIVVRVWEKKAETVLPDLVAAAKAGDLYETDRILDALLITAEIEEKLAKIRVIMQAAMLFGAELVNGDVKTSKLFGDGQSVLLDSAVEAYRGMVTTGLHKLVARQAGITIGALISKTETDAELVKKAELSMDDAVRAMVLGNGQMMASIAANLTTSRLVNYGSLYEMNASGIQKYQLNATLDQRTSQVCRRMHGKVFEVEAALKFTDTALRITDPNELRSAAPWVKGDKKTLYMLEHSSSKELQAKGILVPPFHPRCRTVVEPLGDVILTGLEFTPVKLPVDPDIAWLASIGKKKKPPVVPVTPTPEIDALKPEDEIVHDTNDPTYLKPKE